MAIIFIGYHNRLTQKEHHMAPPSCQCQDMPSCGWWDICHTCQLNLWDSPSHSRHLWFRLSSTCPKKKVPEKWHGAMDETAKKIWRLWTFHRPISLSLSPSPSRGYRPISVCFLYLSYTYHIYISHYIIYVTNTYQLVQDFATIHSMRWMMISCCWGPTQNCSFLQCRRQPETNGCIIKNHHVFP